MANRSTERNRDKTGRRLLQSIHKKAAPMVKAIQEQQAMIEQLLKITQSQIDLACRRILEGRSGLRKYYSFNTRFGIHPALWE
jgi:Mg2+ and Co2+ transporter CorA